MQSSNKAVAEKATAVVYKLSQKPAERAGLVSNAVLLEAVTKEIKAARHGELAKLMAIVNNISKNQVGKEAIFKVQHFMLIFGPYLLSKTMKNRVLFSLFRRIPSPNW